MGKNNWKVHSVRICFKAGSCPVQSKENCDDCILYSKLKEYERKQERIRKGASG